LKLRMLEKTPRFKNRATFRFVTSLTQAPSNLETPPRLGTGKMT